MEKLSDEYRDTIGATFTDKNNLSIWDTVGQFRCRMLIPMYISRAGAILIVFDISDRSSFDSLKKWYETVKKAVDEMKIMPIIVGNNTDLERTVSREEADAFASKKKFGIFRGISKNRFRHWRIIFIFNNEI